MPVASDDTESRWNHSPPAFAADADNTLRLNGKPVKTQLALTPLQTAGAVLGLAALLVTMVTSLHADGWIRYPGPVEAFLKRPASPPPGGQGAPADMGGGAGQPSTGGPNGPQPMGPPQAMGGSGPQNMRGPSGYPGPQNTGGPSGYPGPPSRGGPSGFPGPQNMGYPPSDPYAASGQYGAPPPPGMPQQPPAPTGSQ